MLNPTNKAILSQFIASITMLENAVLMCPAYFWNTEKKFWYHAFHATFYLDYYLTLDVGGFEVIAPFNLSEFEDQMPEKVYSKNEILIYIDYCKTKCTELLNFLDDKKLQTTWTNQSKTMNFSILELLLYNIRHVQHHTAQLNLLLRQEINDAPEWLG